MVGDERHGLYPVRRALAAVQLQPADSMRLFTTFRDWLWQRKRYCYCCRSHHDKSLMRRHPRIAAEHVCRFCWRLTGGRF